MLRKLQEKDIEGMLEWMHDVDSKQYFRFDTLNTKREQVQEFVVNSFTEECQHYAVVDDNDTYMGTISLKNINYKDLNAEYAISMRKMAQGKGIAYQATKDLLKIGFEEMGLKKIYLNVLSDNARAIAFYEKLGFKFEGEFLRHVFIDGLWKNLKWYAMEAEFYEKYVL